MDYPAQEDSPKINLSTLNERVSFGKKLYIAAWGIEILAAVIGLSVAIAMTLASSETLFKDDTMTELEAVSEMALSAIPFVMVAIVELLKIPMVYLIYTSPSFKQKVTFSIILLGLTFITFETVVGGFERQYSIITRDASAPLENIRTNEERIALLKNQNQEIELTSDSSISKDYKQRRLSSREKFRALEIEINKEIVSIQSGPEMEQLTLLEERFKRADEQYKERKEGLESNAGQSTQDAKDKRSILKEQIQDSKKEKEKLEEKVKNSFGCILGSCKEEEKLEALALNIAQLESDLRDKSHFNLSDAKKSLREELKLDEINQQINKLKDTIRAKDINSFEVEALKKRIKEASNTLKEEINGHNLKEKQAKERLNISSVTIQENKERIKSLSKENENLLSDLSKHATTTQLYRFAKYWKQAFTPDQKCIEYKDQNNNINQGNSKMDYGIFNEIFLSSNDPECSQYVDNERVQIQDITQDDVTKVAFVWFGSLAALVSIMGVVVAYGAFILKYPRKEHYMRENSQWSLTKTLRNWFAARIKKARKPRPTKEVPVEVIKEVPVDKVVFKEVPIEVVKKEVVHTPIYTNDPDLLKFGTTKIKDILKNKKEDDGE